jgi:monovalent cation:H+ antiporter-2, CPA2 family
VQEDFRLIVDLVLVLGAAAAGGLLAALLKQPVLLGYLIAGVIVGPTGLALIKEVVQVETLAQFGVAFLLFALGVEFSFSELNKVKVISLGGGGLQIFVTILVTTLVSLAIGWVDSPPQGVFLGAILSLSSTAVVLKSLMERNETDTPHGQVMLGILVVQDLALGLMLAVLPALDQPVEELGLAIGWALLQTALFAVGATAAGIWLIPPLLRLFAKTESRELFLLGVCAICLSIALLTEHLGLSIEMGAFVAGLMISEAEYADEALTYVEPIRDIFAALFFAAIGMLIDPVFLWQNWQLILGLVTIVLFGKFLIVAPLVRIFGYPLRTALISGLGLAQIGEFSFVLASEGRTLGLVSKQVYLLILGTTAVTLVVTPFVLRAVPQLLTWAESIPWLNRYLTQADVPVEASEDVPQQGHVVVCGYGRIGRNIVRVLQQRNYPVVVIDQSESRVQLLRDQGIPYVYGNAGSLYVLEKAALATAACMAIALPDPMSSRLSLKRALEISPNLDVVVRASKPTDVDLLYQLGAKEVVQPELEASLELSAHVLKVGTEATVVQQLVQDIRNSRYAALRSDRPIAAIAREVKAATSDLNRRWYLMPDSSPLLGMTLEEMDIRQLTGATLMAIRRPGSGEIDYPQDENTLEQGDRVLLIGSDAEIAAFDELAKGEAVVPSGNNCCQWVRIEPETQLVDQPLAQLQQQFPDRFAVQAMRREGNFMRSPESSQEIAAGDRLLLCGTIQALKQVQHWIEAKPST